MLYGGASWIGTEMVIAFPVVRRSVRASGETATAIGAHIAQNALYTALTKRTFERTNHCLG